MKRRDASLVGQLIRAFLREEGLETPLNEHRAAAAWGDVMGPQVARWTGGVEVRSGMLYVKILRPSLRADLMMRRREIVRRLNERVGAEVLRGVVMY